MPHLPDIVKIQRKGTGEAVAMVKICIDQGGRVNQVSIIQGIPGADNDIMATLRTLEVQAAADSDLLDGRSSTSRSTIARSG